MTSATISKQVVYIVRTATSFFLFFEMCSIGGEGGGVNQAFKKHLNLQQKLYAITSAFQLLLSYELTKVGKWLDLSRQLRPLYGVHGGYAIVCNCHTLLARCISWQAVCYRTATPTRHTLCEIIATGCDTRRYDLTSRRQH